MSLRLTKYTPFSNDTANIRQTYTPISNISNDPANTMSKTEQRTELLHRDEMQTAKSIGVQNFLCSRFSLSDMKINLLGAIRCNMLLDVVIQFYLN